MRTPPDKFFVDVFAKASVFDTRPHTLTEEYIEYCRASYITSFEDITAAEGSLWGAEEVYLATSDEGDEMRLIRFPDRVLVISSDSLTYTEDVVKGFMEAMV